MSECKKVFITTPIYYVNDIPHIGHAYTTIIADFLARYSRLKGLDVFFLTGTDEHGQKIEEVATARGKTPKAYADEISGEFRKLWDYFDISYDKYIRTTDAEHIQGVQKAFEVMFDKGDIYKGEYEGHYCVSCETFFTKKQLIGDDGCPDCGKSTKLLKEESYFFRLSKYEKQLLDWYESADECILPKAKKNEIISFVKEGLRDLSITRTSFDWGIKIPSKIGDDKHVIYVWLDALLNYITALGYGTDEANMKFWPAKIQLVGKDILRFHSVYWPAFLLSLDLPLPHHIGSHGWWTRDGAKMSKSKGNVVNPKEVADAYGYENFRYFLLREVPFGADGDFSQKALIDRINGDLGNDLGNLLNRLVGMSEKYFDNTIISSADFEYKAELSAIDANFANLEKLIYEMKIHQFLEELWKPLSVANKAIELAKPWELMKNNESVKVADLLVFIGNVLAKVAIMLHPLMPRTTNDLASSLGFEINQNSYASYIEQNGFISNFSLTKIPPLFPKIEEIKLAQPSTDVAPNIEKPKETKNEDGLIGIDDFFKTTIKIGTILQAENVAKSNKLLKLLVDLGEDKPRQVIAGIAMYYKVEELIDTQVCVVANLKPAKLMGLESHGMILAAKDENGLHLIRPQSPKIAGTQVK